MCRRAGDIRQLKRNRIKKYDIYVIYVIFQNKAAINPNEVRGARPSEHRAHANKEILLFMFPTECRSRRAVKGIHMHPQTSLVLKLHVVVRNSRKKNIERSESTEERSDSRRERVIIERNEIFRGRIGRDAAFSHGKNLLHFLTERIFCIFSRKESSANKIISLGRSCRKREELSIDLRQSLPQTATRHKISGRFCTRNRFQSETI